MLKFAGMDREEINSDIHKFMEKLPDEMFEGLDEALDNYEDNKTKLLRISHSLNTLLREDETLLEKLSK
ncbi:hypothetical protein GCM10028791_22620 [Echinicola sediminis]